MGILHFGDRFIRSVGFFALLLSAATFAQSPAQLNPGQIEKQFQRPPEPRSQPGRLQLPQPTQTAPANAADIRFRLSQVIVEGATVYPESSLRPYYEGLLGTDVSLADVYAIANAITIRYRNDGYILSQVLVPEQTLEGGRVRLQAVEGYVADVQVERQVEGRRDLVSAYAAQIKAARPLTAEVLERYLLLMNDLPGAFARAMLLPSKVEQGASDLVVQFSQQGASGGLSVDNLGSEALGQVQWSAYGNLNSAFELQERTGITIVSTLNRELDYLSLAHDQQIGSDGGKLGLLLNFVRSQPDVSQSFVPLNLQTKATSGSATYSYPLVRSRRQNLYLRGALSAYDGSTRLFETTNANEHIRTVRVGATYDLADSYRGINIVDVEIAQGLNGLGASSAGDPNLSRVNGRPDFSKLTLYAARLQWLAERWTLLAAMNAQYSSCDLLAPELFSFGGAQFGRGYDPSELVGDDGAAMKVELRYTNTLENGFAYTGYGFYDLGVVRLRTPEALDASTSAASTGLGLRFNLGRYLSGFVELAKPLTKLVVAEGNRNPRGYFGLSVRF